MLIGNSYADNKIYRGIEYYNNRPLTARDLHEQSDTLIRKNALIMDNIIGKAGVLKKPLFRLSDNNKKLSLVEPIPVIIEGDTFLVYSENPIIDISGESISASSEHTFCIIGWYQKLDNTTTLRSYGGVINSPINNDIIDPDIDVLTSTRYQFRWDIISISGDLGTSRIEISKRDKNGDKVEDQKLSVSYTGERLGNAYIYDTINSNDMSYKVSNLYLLPIFSYTQSPSGIGQMNTVSPLKPATADGLEKVYCTAQFPVNDDIIHPMPFTMKEGDIAQVFHNGVLVPESEYSLFPYTSDPNDDWAIQFFNNYTLEEDDEITVVLTRIKFGD